MLHRVNSMENEKKVRLTILAILIVLGVIIVGFYLWQTNLVGSSKANLTPKTTAEVTPELAAPAINSPAQATPAAVTQEQLETASNTNGIKPLLFSIKNQPVSSERVITSFGYTAYGLETKARACKVTFASNYFDELVAKFSKADRIYYNFKYTGKNQDDSIYRVTILPNKAGYTTMEQFKHDFNICTPGERAYPFMLNSNWLIFTSSCDNGTNNSQKVNGCEEARKIVEPTLKFK